MMQSLNLSRVNRCLPQMMVIIVNMSDVLSYVYILSLFLHRDTPFNISRKLEYDILLSVLENENIAEQHIFDKSLGMKIR